MGVLKNFVTPLHQATKRDYLARMVDDKVSCMLKAKEYEFDYWDGDRRFGYGGYRFIEGRWRPVAEDLIKNYKCRQCGGRITREDKLAFNNREKAEKKLAKEI